MKEIPASAIVLNPESTMILSRKDRSLISQHGLVGIDCSWNKSQPVFEKNIRGQNRILPPLLAGNPINYGIIGKLSTAEALAAALFITGFREHAGKILSLFKWGPTFLSLNAEPLESYAAE